MLIDRFLPAYDATAVCEIEVGAPPARAWEAIRSADLRDPVVTALFAERDLPLRFSLLWRRPPPPLLTRASFGDLRSLGIGWMALAEDPGVEFVVGSVGRFWRKDYGGRPVRPDEFFSFHEAGYAKLAISLSVRPAADGSLIRFEARIGTVDEIGRRTFRRYWRKAGPAAGLAILGALTRIRAVAESVTRPVGPVSRAVPWEVVHAD